MPRSSKRYVARFSTGQLSGPDFAAPCVFGEAGLIAAHEKREGDKASPIGVWPVRRALFRADRITAPTTQIRLDAIAPDDGWCDDLDDIGYNRQIRRSYTGRHEVLTREDGLYDLLVVLGHNDDPPVPGLGSAIFLPCQNPDAKPTLGCLAGPRASLIDLVGQLTPGDEIEIAR